MNLDHYYDSILPKEETPESSTKIFELPVFAYISRTPQLNTSISEKEELESLTNVSAHLRVEVSTYFAIAKIQEATQHESVRHLISKQILDCISQVSKEIKNRIDQSDSASGGFQIISKKDENIFEDDDDLPEDDEIRILLEIIPHIYQHSSNEERAEFNKSLQTLLTNLAPIENNFKKALSFYPYFKLVVECVINIFLLGKKALIPSSNSEDLNKSMTYATFTIARNLNEKIKDFRNEELPYFGTLIHLAAEGADLLAENDLLLLQQLFVTFVMSWDDLLSNFSMYSEDLMKIALMIPPLSNFDEAFKMTVSLCHYNELDRTKENLASSINHYFDTISVKEVIPFKKDEDLLLFLSIAVLEKTRAKAGDFSTFFEYFKSDYYPAFTLCLRNLITPLFNNFMEFVNSNCPTDKKNAAVDSLVQKCFKYYVGKNAELAFLIDKISPELFKRFNLVLFSPQTVANMIESLSTTEEYNPSRLDRLNTIVKALIADCLKAAPNSLFSLFHDYILKKMNSSHEGTPSVYTVISLMPPKTRDNFLVEMLEKSSVYGSAKNMTLQEILAISNPDERVMHLAFKITKEEDFQLMMIKEATPKVLVEAWFYIMNTKTLKSSIANQFNLENTFLSVIVRELTKSMKMQQGLFSAQYDEEMVNFHTAIFKFLYELVSISSFLPQIHQVLPPMKNLMLIESPPALSGLLHFGLFLSSILMKPPMPPNLHEIAFNKFILVIMKIISLNAAPTTFRYIRAPYLPLFNRLLSVFPAMYKYSLFSSDSKNQSNINLNSDSYGSTFTDHYSTRKKNRIDYSINKQQFCYIPDIEDLKIKFIQSQKIFINSLQTSRKQYIIKKLLDFLGYSLTQMFALFSTYLLSSKDEDIINTAGRNYLKLAFTNSAINDLIPTFWSFCPSAIPAFSTIMNFPIAEVTKCIKPYFEQSYPYQLAFESHLAQIFVNVKIDDLSLCELLPPAQSIVLLKHEVLAHPTASQYLVKCLDNFELDEILQYIPQLVQSIRFDDNKILAKFLRKFARKSCIFQHYLLWNIIYEKCRAIDQNDVLPGRLVVLEGKVTIDMNEEEKELCKNEFDMIDQFEKISHLLLPLPVDQRKIQLPIELKKIKIPTPDIKDRPNATPLAKSAPPIKSSLSVPSISNVNSNELYVPSNPNYKILGINAKESKPLKSAAKVPLLITFTVYNCNQKKKREKMNFSCIFKTNDDVRMDAMMIQIIDKFKRIFIDAGIDCYLLPYRVFATGQERGVIECITHAKSRHEIGELTKEDLLTYFIHTYGQVGTEAFDKAQMNFIKSLAPYSLICYLFQIKDRHNANIMIDDDGHVIHIDFGFIFDISPGNNLNFERAPFKLTQEMVNLMGGSKDAKPFNDFVQLFTKCFIAVRARYDEIEAISSLMINAGFPCFRKDSFVRLRQRFCMDSCPSALAGIVDSLVSDSLGSFTTSGYDFIQKHQNKIFTI